MTLDHIADAVRILRPGADVRDALHAVEAAHGHVYATPMDGAVIRDVRALYAAWTAVCREIDAEYCPPADGSPTSPAWRDRAGAWRATSWWLTRALERAVRAESINPHSGTTREQVAPSPITASKEPTR